MSNAIAIAGGKSHSVMLRGDGTVWCWGYNGRGQLGDSTTTQRTTAVQVTAFTAADQIAAGEDFSLALKNDGSVWAWGTDSDGELGNTAGAPNYSSSPVQALSACGSSLSPNYAVLPAAGGNFSVRVFAPAGCNWNGLSDAFWLQVPAGPGGSANGIFNYTALANTSAMARMGTMTIAGQRFFVRQIGNAPVMPVTQIAAGEDFSLALEANGKIRAWGYNYYGQLGDGATTNRLVPVQVVGLTGVVAIAAGEDFSVALKGDGTVWTWGHGTDGELGDGFRQNRYLPVQVEGLNDAVAISAGNIHAAAVRGGGTVVSWGYNGYGRLGDGSTDPSYTPVEAAGLRGISSVASRFHHGLGLMRDGAVWSWGTNSNGALGSGDTTVSHSTVPRAVVVTSLGCVFSLAPSFAAPGASVSAATFGVVASGACQHWAAMSN